MHDVRAPDLSSFAGRLSFVLVANLAVSIIAASAAPAQAGESVLYSFQGGSDGATPQAGLVGDQQGALYGASYFGGSSSCGEGCGTVFKLTPPAAGQTQWTESVLYTFCAQTDCTDGAYPYGGLIFDQNGALYGTTTQGGSADAGTVFKLTPPAPGQTQWTESVLYSFRSTPDGYDPVGTLVFDQQGALYGITEYGGTGQTPSWRYGWGTVFKLTPPSGQQTEWTESILYNFCSQSNCTDGSEPMAGLIFDQDSALYGTTDQGGSAADGTVFKLTPPSGEQAEWTESVLYSFCSQTNCADGASPYTSGLIFDQQGALYGTTHGGGNEHLAGTVFELTPPSGQQTQWTESILYSFQNGTDGSGPQGGLIFNQDGALYGTTSGGGSEHDGAVFKLTPPAAGQTQWTETALHEFLGAPDGAQPEASLMIGAGGALYGSTSYGGAGNGTVFAVLAPSDTHDFNADGTSDILWADASGDVAMWLMSEGQISSGAALGNVGTSWSVAGTHDFAGNGYAGILWLDTAGDVATWLMSGTSVGSYNSLGNVGTQWQVTGAGDFNGDGAGDILWRNTSTGDLAIWLMNSGQFGAGIDLGVVPLTWSVVGTGDFNGDGTADILWRNVSSGELAIWFMSKGQVSSSLDVGSVSTDWTVVGTGDFNGDAVSDILWRDSEGDAAIWLMNNSGQMAAGATFSGIPTTWSVAETGDFNGDGLSDILWIDESGDLGVWLMNGLSISSTIGLGNIGTSWQAQGRNAD